MRSHEDALRSVRRYVASALGSPPWRVRMAMDGRFKRPYAMVAESTQSIVSQGGPSSMREELPMVVQCYPEEPDDSTGPLRTTAAKLAATRAGDQLAQALMVGVADQQDPTVRGYMHRIPLWDYTDDAGVPLPLEGSGSVATRRGYADYLLVPEGGWNVRVQPEASEQQLWVAILNVRVQWFRATLLADTGPLLESIQLTAATDPAQPDVTVDL